MGGSRAMPSPYHGTLACPKPGPPSDFSPARYESVEMRCSDAVAGCMQQRETPASRRRRPLAVTASVKLLLQYKLARTATKRRPRPKMDLPNAVALRDPTVARAARQPPALIVDRVSAWLAAPARMPREIKWARSAAPRQVRGVACQRGRGNATSNVSKNG